MSCPWICRLSCSNGSLALSWDGKIGQQAPPEINAMSPLMSRVKTWILFTECHTLLIKVSTKNLMVHQDNHLVDEFAYSHIANDSECTDNVKAIYMFTVITKGDHHPLSQTASSTKSWDKRNWSCVENHLNEKSNSLYHLAIQRPVSNEAFYVTTKFSVLSIMSLANALILGTLLVDTCIWYTLQRFKHAKCFRFFFIFIQVHYQ